MGNWDWEVVEVGTWGTVCCAAGVDMLRRRVKLVGGIFLLYDGRWGDCWRVRRSGEYRGMKEGFVVGGTVEEVQRL